MESNGAPEEKKIEKKENVNSSKKTQKCPKEDSKTAIKKNFNLIVKEYM